MSKYRLHVLLGDVEIELADFERIKTATEYAENKIADGLAIFIERTGKDEQ